MKETQTRQGNFEKVKMILDFDWINNINIENYSKNLKNALLWGYNFDTISNDLEPETKINKWTDGLKRSEK